MEAISIYTNKISGFMKDILFESPLTKSMDFYSLKFDGGLMMSVYKAKLCLEEYQKAKASNYSLFLLMIAWDIFDLGVFTSQLILEKGKGITEIPQEEVEDRLSQYYDEPFLERTAKMLGYDFPSEEADELTNITKKYVAQVVKNYPKEIRNDDYLLPFLEIACDAGSTLEMKKNEGTEQYDNTRWMYFVT